MKCKECGKELEVEIVEHGEEYCSEYCLRAIDVRLNVY